MNQKKNKKASIFNSLNGIILFCILFIAIIVLITRCSASERKVDEIEALKKLDEAIKETLATQGAIQRIQIELDINSAIIVYSKDHDLIKTTYYVDNLKVKIPDNLE